MNWKTTFVAVAVMSVVFAQETVKEPPAEFNRGIELLQNGDYDGAIAKWEQALQKDSTLAAAWFNMAIAYDMQGQDSAAISCYHRAADLNL